MNICVFCFGWNLDKNSGYYYTGIQFEGDLGKILILGAKISPLYWSQVEVGVSLKKKYSAHHRQALMKV